VFHASVANMPIEVQIGTKTASEIKKTRDSKIIAIGGKKSMTEHHPSGKESEKLRQAASGQRNNVSSSGR